jgi:hypothetical protein
MSLPGFLAWLLIGFVEEQGEKTRQRGLRFSEIISQTSGNCLQYNG